MADTPHARARALIEEKNFTEAEAILSQLVTAQPADGLGWQLLGTTLLRKGDKAGASIAYRRALVLVPTDYISSYGLAVALKDLGQTEEAIGLLRRTRELKPDFAPAVRKLSELEAAQAIPTPPVPTPVPAPSPAPARVSKPPAFAVAPPAGWLVGQARAIQKNREADPWIQQSHKIVWDFRVERKDPDGRDLPTIPVRLEGDTIDGALMEGDWVAVPRPWTPGTTASPEQVLNLTTGAPVRAHTKGSQLLKRILVIAFVIAFLAFASWVVYNSFFADNTGGQAAVTADGGGGGGNNGGGGGGDGGGNNTGGGPVGPTATGVTTGAPPPASIDCSNTDGTQDVAINTGETVTFTNVADEPMTLGFGEPDPSTFEPATLDPGGQYELAFPESGTFSYSCVFSVAKQTGFVNVG